MNPDNNKPSTSQELAEEEIKLIKKEQNEEGIKTIEKNEYEINKKIKNNQKIIADKELELKLNYDAKKDVEQEFLTAAETDKKELKYRLNKIKSKIENIKSEINFYYLFNNGLMLDLLELALIQLQKDGAENQKKLTKKVNFNITEEQKAVEKISGEINDLRRKRNSLYHQYKKAEQKNIEDIKLKIKELKTKINCLKEEKEKINNYQR